MKINILEFLKTGAMPINLGDSTSQCELILGSNFIQKETLSNFLFYFYEDGIELFFIDKKLKKIIFRFNEEGLNYDISSLGLEFQYLSYQTKIHEFLQILSALGINYEVKEEEKSSDYFTLTINKNINILYNIYIGDLFQIQVYDYPLLN